MLKSARQKGLKMHLSSMITHLTLNQSHIKCSVVAGQPRWDHAPHKQAIADRK